MAITPISGTEFITPQQKVNLTGQGKEGFAPFSDFFSQAVEEVNASQAQVQQDILKIATGDTDALHTITMNMAKADLALHTLVQVRNKTLDAYNEIMRITL